MHEHETFEVTPSLYQIKISQLFPQSKIRNIALFYLLTATNNAWFIAGNWIFYWTRFMTYGQLGIMDATAFAFGLLLEIPSGAVSDLLGKRKTLIAAMFFSTFGVLMMAASTSMAMLWVAFFIAQVGWAFYSGAAEALAYDTLKEKHEEDNYDQVISASVTVAQITSIIATLTGGILYAWHFRLSHLAWGLTLLLGFIATWWLREPKVDTEHFSFSAYRQQLTQGVKELFTPALKPFLLLILTLLGFEYLYSWGLVKPAMAVMFGFLDKEQAILFALLGIVNAIVVRFIPLFRSRISDKKGLFILAATMSFGFISSYFSLGFWGIGALLLITTSGSLAYPWVSIVVNREIPSQYRATTLSTVALITKLPYVLLAVLAGKMAGDGTFNIFSLGIGIATLAALIITYLQRYLAKK